MRLLSALLAAFAALHAHGADVSVAVAANFAAPMQKIAAGFERETGHRAVVAIGSTGKFHSQIRQGAPFQVLLAADDETPAKLVEEKLAVAGSAFTYATGRLALWSAQPGAVDARGEVLRRAGTSKLAIADPKLAPYGAAAMQVLDKLALRTAWQARLVQGENIAQAYQFVATGNAALGFVALSQVMTDGRIDKGSGWVVPSELHTPLKHNAVLLLRGKYAPAAAALLRYLRSDAARAVVLSYGYER